MTKKQKRFVEEYLIDLNATQAAIRAGYSPDSAGQIGEQNLKKLEISNAISKAMAERSKRTGINADRVILELAKIALANMADVVDTDTAAVKPGASSYDTAAIQSVKVKKSSSNSGTMIEREVRMMDKLKALELLGKHLGMYQNNINVSVETSKKLDDIISQLGGEGLEE